jgi:hypothetical protein
MFVGAADDPAEEASVRFTCTEIKGLFAIFGVM